MLIAFQVSILIHNRVVSLSLRRRAAVSSSHCATFSFSHCAAVLSSRPILTVPHSRCLCCLLSHRRLILLLCRRTLVLSSSSHWCAALLLPCHTGWLLRRLSLCRRLVFSSRHPTLVLSYRCPLTAPPSRCLVTPAGCCVASRRAAISFSRRAAALSFYRCPLTAPPSRCLITLSGPALVASAGAYWRTTTDHRLLPPLAMCDRLGPKVGLLLGLNVPAAASIVVIIIGIGIVGFWAPVVVGTPTQLHPPSWWHFRHDGPCTEQYPESLTALSHPGCEQHFRRAPWVTQTPPCTAQLSHF